MIDKDKPLMQMSKAELDATFDSISEPLEAGLLEEARTETRPVHVVFLLLTLPTGEQRLGFHTMEQGDGEGRGIVIGSLRRQRKMLRPGETLEIHTSVLSLELLLQMRQPKRARRPRLRRPR